MYCIYIGAVLFFRICVSIAKTANNCSTCSTYGGAVGAQIDTGCIRGCKNICGLCSCCHLTQKDSYPNTYTLHKNNKLHRHRNIYRISAVYRKIFYLHSCSSLLYESKTGLKMGKKKNFLLLWLFLE